MTDVVDLDALAAEPLVVRVASKEYTINVDVATVMEIDRGRKAGEVDDWALPIHIMKKAGMSEEVFASLSIAQATRLAELITQRFFPTPPEETKEDEASPSSGPPPSPDSSGTSAEPTPSETS